MALFHFLGGGRNADLRRRWLEFVVRRVRTIRGLLQLSAGHCPLLRKTSPLCGTTILCPFNCCSIRTAPPIARTESPPFASRLTSVFLRRSANRQRFCVQQRRVNREKRFLIHVRMDGAGIECDRQRARRTSTRRGEPALNGNLAPSTKSIVARPDFTRNSPPLRRTVFTLSIDDAHAHRPLHGDGFAFDDADGFFNRFVGKPHEAQPRQQRKRGGGEPAKHFGVNLCGIIVRDRAGARFSIVTDIL